MKVNISDAVLAEIGKIVVVHNLIESSLSNIVGTIVSVGTRRELGQIVTAELSFKQLLSTLRSLLLFALGPDHESVVEFDGLKKRLTAADEQRNSIVHSVWSGTDDDDPDNVYRIKTTAKENKGFRTQFVRISLEQLKSTAGELGETYGAIAQFELRFQGDHDAG